LIVIRGGGSAEDLAAFSTEVVTRAVAASRVPTLVAIGHEVDVCLAELAADRRASTPSNAAELLVPDRTHIKRELNEASKQLERLGQAQIQAARRGLTEIAEGMEQNLALRFAQLKAIVKGHHQLLEALNPLAILRRGYAIVRQNDQTLRSTHGLKADAIVNVQLTDGRFVAKIDEVSND
jgi:exodeoxyribonuclease VII large subunit